ncbi:MAG: ribonuclease BN (tRNA processing enzyme) [Cellvibrionaceae bacterium]|jgi:ribonuclease BN (tRNA processing enzyme)
MNHILYFNGTGPATNEMFGCPCNRCNTTKRLANVSVSLISHDNRGNTLHHALFDAGDGIATSLAQSPWLKHKNGRLDQVFLSHWHRDHTLHLNRVLVANHLRGERLGIHPNSPAPLWCRSGTAAWLRDLYDFEISNYLTITESNEQELPGTLLKPIYLKTIPDVTITPFSLSHFSADFSLDRQTYTSSCAGFVLQGPNKKIVMFWDADTTNEKWITDPQTTAQKKTIELLSNADLLIIDTVTWVAKYDREYPHLSFPRTITIAKALRPKQTMPVHISGHPDGLDNGSWGWSDADWQKNGSRVWQAEDAPGNYYVPSIGDSFEL